MQLADFTHLIDAYGADPERWPPDQRAAALALAASDAGAETLLHEARGLDRLLDAAPIQAPSLALRTAVASAAGLQVVSRAVVLRSNWSEQFNQR